MSIARLWRSRPKTLNPMTFNLPTPHIILLGDSIFDNEAYVKGGLDVITHLRGTIPAEWRATLRAVDGSTVESVRGQARDLPADATHLIVSAGGNDALLQADILQQKAESSSEVLNKLADIAAAFELNYRGMLRGLSARGRATAVCTIYYPRIPDPSIQRIAVVALTIFNDVIIRQAFLAGLPLIDLRLVCSEETDYANEIEPSDAGGRKIAESILRLVKEHNFDNHRTAVFI
jgi:GDSL-like Lipase/Acylhydrolase family